MEVVIGENNFYRNTISEYRFLTNLEFLKSVLGYLFLTVSHYIII